MRSKKKVSIFKSLYPKEPFRRREKKKSVACVAMETGAHFLLREKLLQSECAVGFPESLLTMGGVHGWEMCVCVCVCVIKLFTTVDSQQSLRSKPNLNYSPSPMFSASFLFLGLMSGFSSRF